MFWLKNKKINFVLMHSFLGIDLQAELFIDLEHLSIRFKIVNIFLSIIYNICFGFPKEPSHLDGYFEYPQHMFWLRDKKINFLLCTLI